MQSVSLGNTYSSEPVRVDRSEHGERAALTISVACFLLTLILAAFIYVARLGFEDNCVRAIELYVSVSAIVLLGPSAIRTMTPQPRLWSGEAFCTTGILVVLTALGCARSSVLAQWLVPILGAVCAIVGMLALSKNRLRNPLVLCAAVLALGAFLIGAVLTDYHDPLLIEKLPWTHRAFDTIFHSCLSSNWEAYNQQSTGMDGLRYMSYHGATAFMLSRWHQLLGQSPVSMWSLGYPLILVPLFFKSLFTFAISLKSLLKLPADGEPNALFWLIICATTIGPFSEKLTRGLLLIPMFGNESYLVALVYAFLGGACLLDFSRQAVAENQNNASLAKQITTQTSLVILGSLLMALVTFTKLSLFALLLPVLAYSFLKLRLFKSPLAWIGLLLSVSAGLVVNILSKEYACAGAIKFSPMDYLNTYIAPEFYPVYFLAFYASLSFIAFDLIRNNVGNWRQFKQAFFSNRLLGSEVVLVFSAAALVASNLVELAGAAGLYFLDVQLWVSTALALALAPTVSTNISVLSKKPFNRLWVSVACVAFCGWLCFKSAASLIFGVEQNIGSRLALLDVNQKQSMTSEGPEVIPEVKSHTRFNLNEALRRSDQLLRGPQEALLRNPAYRMMQQLVVLRDKPIEFRSKTLLFIPQSSVLYWSLLPTVYAPFLGPALAGMAQLDGIPQWPRKYLYFGYEVYPERTRAQTPDDEKPQAIQRLAEKVGFKQVLVFRATETGCTTELLNFR